MPARGPSQTVRILCFCARASLAVQGSGSKMETRKRGAPGADSALSRLGGGTGASLDGALRLSSLLSQQPHQPPLTGPLPSGAPLSSAVAADGSGAPGASATASPVLTSASSSSPSVGGGALPASSPVGRLLAGPARPTRREPRPPPSFLKGVPSLYMAEEDTDGVALPPSLDSVLKGPGRARGSRSLSCAWAHVPRRVWRVGWRGLHGAAVGGAAHVPSPFRFRFTCVFRVWARVPRCARCAGDDSAVDLSIGLELASSPLSPVDKFTKPQIQAHVRCLRAQPHPPPPPPPPLPPHCTHAHLCAPLPGCRGCRAHGCVQCTVSHPPPPPYPTRNLQVIALRSEAFIRRYRPVIMRLMEHPMNGGVFNEPVDPVVLEVRAAVPLDNPPPPPPIFSMG